MLETTVVRAQDGQEQRYQLRVPLRAGALHQDRDRPFRIHPAPVGTIADHRVVGV